MEQLFAVIDMEIYKVQLVSVNLIPTICPLLNKCFAERALLMESFLVNRTVNSNSWDEVLFAFKHGLDFCLSISNAYGTSRNISTVDI